MVIASKKSACHLLSVVCPYPITGAAVSVDNSRIDFDLAQASISKEEVTEKLVSPPRGMGKIRLVCIGNNASIDSQPCGGTHVTETGEIGDIHIAKIEKKGNHSKDLLSIKLAKTKKLKL